jgi:3-hydroxyisobutyrate dehydrogenase
MTDVAVLGTGTMGAPMAHNLLRAGHRVRVWNRTPGRTAALVAAGATAAGSPAEAVAGADVVLTMLFDLAATRAVVEEAADAFGADPVLLQMGTIGPDGTAELAQLAGSRGIALVDAPVLGTRKPAEDGTLVVLASGDPGLRERVDPVLDAISGKVVWVDDTPGAASKLKLACNAWVLTLTAATAQSLALATALQLDPRVFLQAIAGGGTDSPYAQTKGPAMLAGSFAPAFGLDGALKDLDLIVAAAQGAGVPDGLLGAVREAYADASRQGHGADDIAAVYTALRPST